jgi:hypothetical protein
MLPKFSAVMKLVTCLECSNCNYLITGYRDTIGLAQFSLCWCRILFWAPKFSKQYLLLLTISTV